MLTEEAMSRIPLDRHAMYERIWDESDYVIPPAENSAFFVMTNVVLTPNQTRTSCPEDHSEMPGLPTDYLAIETKRKIWRLKSPKRKIFRFFAILHYKITVGNG